MQVLLTVHFTKSAHNFRGVAIFRTTVMKSNGQMSSLCSIRDYMLERQQAWVLGNGDVEAEWEDYTAQLDKKGLGKVLEVMQSAYDRQYAK